MTITQPKLKLAVWKFASCGGCQLSLLDLLDELGGVEIASFPELSRTVAEGPYDVSLVEGSVTTSQDLERIREVREASRVLVTLGSCAAGGGVQALRNRLPAPGPAPAVYPRPEGLEALRDCTPIHRHVRVDHRLFGCPVDPRQVRELLRALVEGTEPRLGSANVCAECRRKGFDCVMTARRQPCLGAATRSGCGALCPAYGRGCFGCFGPRDGANLAALGRAWRKVGASEAQVVQAFRSFHGESDLLPREVATREN